MFLIFIQLIDIPMWCERISSDPHKAAFTDEPSSTLMGIHRFHTPV